MEILKTISNFRDSRDKLTGSVAFVPTMGSLHDGHLSLMRKGSDEADNLVVSIFVNPTQFGPDEDYEDYPRELKKDAEKCRQLGVDLVFAPNEAEMYYDDHKTTVDVEQLTDVLCGAHRPGHFDGVCTVVSKLFNIVQPDVAVFGEKDYQQLAIIRRMVRDLNIPVDIVGGPIVRESDGLAVSSRNQYLDESEREDAKCLSQALKQGWIAGRQSNASAELVLRACRERLLETVEPTQIDYIDLVHPENLESLMTEMTPRLEELDEAILLTAVDIGEARLIDNIHLKRPLPKELK
jgi:pantoate--beta-alanine ligase